MTQIKITNATKAEFEDSSSEFDFESNLVKISTEIIGFDENEDYSIKLLITELAHNGQVFFDLNYSKDKYKAVDKPYNSFLVDFYTDYNFNGIRVTAYLKKRDNTEFFVKALNSKNKIKLSKSVISKSSKLIKTLYPS